MKKLCITLILSFLANFQLAAVPVDTYEFAQEVDRIRYQYLVKELRCPKCQNQNLADSNSQIAIDLREQVYDMVNEGKSDGEIMNYMVDRYGDFVLYRPKLSETTYILWFGPIILMLVGLLVVFIILRKKPEKQANAELTAEQKQKLEQILKDK